jgi:uncharacterized OB-fold protein
MQTQTIAYRICPQCGEVTMPNTLRCPNDGCKLEPVFGDEDVLQKIAEAGEYQEAR